MVEGREAAGWGSCSYESAAEGGGGKVFWWSPAWDMVVAASVGNLYRCLSPCSRSGGSQKHPKSRFCSAVSRMLQTIHVVDCVDKAEMRARGVGKGLGVGRGCWLSRRYGWG